jgi:hypothetical protein
MPNQCFSSISLPLLGLLLTVLLLVSSCTQEYQDKGTKADLTTKAKSELDFVGVHFTVTNGVITLTGNCPTPKAKAEVEKTAAAIAGVKQVVNQITIAPVVISSDRPLQQKVDSLLMAYPQAQGKVLDSVVTLQGQALERDVEKLQSGLKQLKIKGVDNQLSVQAGS